MKVLYSIPLVIKAALSLFANDRNNMGSLHPNYWKNKLTNWSGRKCEKPWVFYSQLTIIWGSIRKIMRAWNSRTIVYSIMFCGKFVKGKDNVLELVSLGKHFAAILIPLETQFYIWRSSQAVSFQISQYVPMN